MRKFKKVVREIVYTIDGILILPILLNATIIFLAIYLVLLLFDFSPLLSYVTAIIYLFIAVYKQLEVNKIKLVELIYPDLNEKLRTAADYSTQDGEIIDELHKEVASDLKYVASSSFIDTKRLGGKVVISLALCFLIIFVSALNIDLSDFKADVRDRIDDVSQQLFSGEATDQTFKTSSSTTHNRGSTDIFGEESVAQLGNKELDVIIKPSTYEFNIRNVQDAEEKEFDTLFPEDITLEQAGSYEENIPKEQRELVKNYFKKLTEG